MLLMPWTFEHHPEFLREYRELPKWKRKVIRDKLNTIKRRTNPLDLASMSGSIARFPLSTYGNLIIGRADNVRCHLIFLTIQIQRYV